MQNSSWQVGNISQCLSCYLLLISNNAYFSLIEKEALHFVTSVDDEICKRVDMSTYVSNMASDRLMAVLAAYQKVGWKILVYQHEFQHKVFFLRKVSALPVKYYTRELHQSTRRRLWSKYMLLSSSFTSSLLPRLLFRSSVFWLYWTHFWNNTCKNKTAESSTSNFSSRTVVNKLLLISGLYRLFLICTSVCCIKHRTRYVSHGYEFLFCYKTSINIPCSLVITSMRNK